MTTTTNIWGTAEADAWGRDFGYSDYLRICAARDTNPVSETAYTLFKRAFHQAMDDDHCISTRAPEPGMTTGGFKL